MTLATDRLFGSRSSVREHYRTRLTYRLLTLSNTLGKGAVRLYAGSFGVPLAQWRVLAALAVEGSSSIYALAEALGTDKGWVSRTAAALRAKGLVSAMSDRPDAKRMKIDLTAKGKALHARIEPAANRRYRRLIAVLSLAERATLDRLLDRLQRRADVLLNVDAGYGAAPASSRRRSGKARAVRPCKQDR